MGIGTWTLVSANGTGIALVEVTGIGISLQHKLNRLHIHEGTVRDTDLTRLPADAPTTRTGRISVLALRMYLHLLFTTSRIMPDPMLVMELGPHHVRP